jgi:hypothetical protein
LGKKTCLAANRVSQQELQHVGQEGLAINAYHGRIAIAGADDRATQQGAVRYLEDHAVRLFASSRIEIPDRRGDMLHELYLLDWPYFRGCPLRRLWPPTTEKTAAKRTQGRSVAPARELAQAIKELARAGHTEVPPALSARAEQSPLLHYVAAQLLWDPFADSTRLIREFTDEH